MQESELTPRDIYDGQLSAIPSQQQLERVYVVLKFNIPDDKVLIMELFEKGGGRHLSLMTTNQDILRARLLSVPSGNRGHALAWLGRIVDQVSSNAYIPVFLPFNRHR